MIKTDFVWLSSGEIFVSIGWRLLVFPGKISSASSENWVWCLWWWHHASYWDTASSFLVTTERSGECQSATNCSCNGYDLRWTIRLGRTFLMLRKMSSWWTSHIATWGGLENFIFILQLIMSIASTIRRYPGKIHSDMQSIHKIKSSVNQNEASQNQFWAWGHLKKKLNILNQCVLSLNIHPRMSIART